MARTTETTTHEQNCLDGADHFTAVRGRGAQRTVEKCDSLSMAEDIARGHGDGRTMIYAITPGGHSAHIKNA